MTELEPFDVANHWPWLRRNLLLDRKPAVDRALEVLARSQVAAEGQAVAIGGEGWRRAGFTAGEGQAAKRALAQLAAQGVVRRVKDAGRHADKWSFTGSVDRWRGMPWETSARHADRVLTACSCRALFAVAAHSPGRRVISPRTALEFHLPSEDHVRPPGLFPVDGRGDRKQGAATADRPGETPVDVRGEGDGSGADALSTGRSKDLPPSEALSEEEFRCFEAFAGALFDGCEQTFYGGPRRVVTNACRGLTMEDARVIIDGLPQLEHAKSGSDLIAAAVPAHFARLDERRRSDERRLEMLEAMKEGDEVLEQEYREVASRLGIGANEVPPAVPAAG